MKIKEKVPDSPQNHEKSSTFNLEKLYPANAVWTLL